MPVALMGFSLQGFFLSQSLRTLSNPVTLLSFTPIPSVLRQSNRSHAFRALLPVRIRHPPPQFYLQPEAGALLGFSPLGISPLAVPTAFTVVPLMNLTCVTANRNAGCPTGSSAARIG